MSDRVEALVVGAGISGFTTAYALQKAGIATRVERPMPGRSGAMMRRPRRVP